MPYTSLTDLGSLAKGVNIHGCRPYQFLPEGCKWYNIVQVMYDELVPENIPEEETEDDMIERSAGIDIDQLLEQLTAIIKNIKKDHDKLLVHVHQYPGTTILHELLKQRTGVKCILDEGDFVQHPTNYRDEYPEIDGLISLEICVGIGCSPGNWIVPKYYLPFSSRHRIIYNEPQYAINHIKKYLPPDFEYLSCPILWMDNNCDPDDIIQGKNYLILDKEAIGVLEFVKENTKIFDETHDWRHAVSVAINSTQILDTRDVLYLALLHDVCDHKYPESMPRSELSEWIKDNIVSDIDIDSMIDRVSFSKQNGDMTKVHPVLEAVRDGDRMEAIGEIGIHRCTEFGKMRGKKIPDHVIRHSHEKLLRLIPEGFIANQTPEAFRRHQVLVDYVKKHSSLE
jgi:uncharacterized protein